MKNTYRVILIGLAVLGIAFASTGPEKKAEESEKKINEVEKETNKVCTYKPIDLCKFPVTMEVGHFVQLKECYKRKIELKQVDCEDIGQGYDKFPCYRGSEVFEVRANFPAIFNATIDKSASDEEILEEVNLYWENGVNTIQGCCGWEELTLCLEAWDVDLYMYNVGTVKVGEITIGVRPPDGTIDLTRDDTKKDKESED